jgi:hypothetical protein
MLEVIDITRNPHGGSEKAIKFIIPPFKRKIEDIYQGALLQ